MSIRAKLHVNAVLFRRVMDFCGDRTLLASVVLPPATWIAAAVSVGGLSLAEAVNAKSFQLFIIFFISLLCLAFVSSLGCRSWHSSLKYAGLLLLMSQGVLWYGFRYDGEAGDGIGEQIVQFHKEERGRWFDDPRIPMRIEKIVTAPEAYIEFSVDSNMQKVVVGKGFNWNGFTVTPRAVDYAPLVKVRSAQGDEVDALYLKLGTMPVNREFFHVSNMPHRIYVTRKGDEGLHIKIIRDKLEVRSGDVAWGEELYYDGHYVSFERGEPWVRIQVKKNLSVAPSVVGLILLVSGFLPFNSKRRE